MKIYDLLSANRLSKGKYAMKFFMATSPLILLALAGPLIFLAINKNPSSVIIASLALLAAAVIAIFLTINIFKALVVPINMAKQALDAYLSTGEIPSLPVQYRDEAGMLLANINTTVSRLNDLIVEKSDMIDLLSHDLRSPVGRILSLSSLIKDEPESEKDMYADYIINECRSLLSMLENILLTLKEDSQEFKVERVNLKSLITETKAFYDFAIAEKSLQINIAIDDSIYIFVQRQLFTQAVRNLLGNAIKFSPDGKAIYISGRSDMDRVTISIKDQGLGLKSADIQKIFNRFTTAGKRGTRGETSTGLGLYLSKKIVEKHGGKLMADSEGENMGASFTITLYTLITKKPQEKNGTRPLIKKVVAFHGR
jgi:signal transduction histidine kinase